MNNSLLHSMRDARWRRFPLLALIVTIFGCLPISLTYWEPAAPGGRLFNGVRGTVGYKDMIELSFKDVRIQFTGGGSWLGVDLLIPEGKSASFVADELELYGDQSSTRAIEFTMTVWDPKTLKPFQISPVSIMHGKNTNVALLGGPQPKSYPSHVEFGGGDRLHYAVKLPSLKVGDQVFDIPVVEFTKKEGFGISPVN